MSVLPFEAGTHPIIHRSVPVPAGSTQQSGYLAIPDVAGPHPAVLVVPGIYGLRTDVKDFCRRLARYGFAALAVDLYRGTKPIGDDLAGAIARYDQVEDRRAVLDLADAQEYLMSEDSDWAAKGGIGLVGIDVGGRFALLHADSDDTVKALGLYYTPLGDDPSRDEQISSVLSRLRLPVLGFYGRDDELVSPASVDSAQALNASGTWILYESVGHDFLDADRTAYHDGAAHDSMERFVALLIATLT